MARFKPGVENNRKIYSFGWIYRLENPERNENDQLTNPLKFQEIYLFPLHYSSSRQSYKRNVVRLVANTYPDASETPLRQRITQFWPEFYFSVQKCKQKQNLILRRLTVGPLVVQ